MPTDQEISALVASGQTTPAMARMLYRLMVAAECQAQALVEIADKLERLAAPAFVVSGGGGSGGAEQVALRPDALVPGEPDPLDAA